MQLPSEVIVDIAAFLDRRTLETVFKAAGRRPAGLTRRYFSRRPYLVIDHLEIQPQNRTVTVTQRTTDDGQMSTRRVDFDAFRAEFCADGRVPPYLRIAKTCMHCTSNDDGAYDILDALNPAWTDLEGADVRLIFFDKDVSAMRGMLNHVRAPSITVVGWQYGQLAELLTLPIVADERCAQLTVHCRKGGLGFESLARSAASIVTWLQNDGRRQRTLRIGGRDLFDWMEQQMIEAFLTDSKPREFVAQFGLLNCIPTSASPKTRQIRNPVTGERLFIDQQHCQTTVRRVICA